MSPKYEEDLSSALGAICEVLTRENHLLFVGRIQAVSYTHLDVYKRQGPCDAAAEHGDRAEITDEVCGHGNSGDPAADGGERGKAQPHGGQNCGRRPYV